MHMHIYAVSIITKVNWRMDKMKTKPKKLMDNKTIVLRLEDLVALEEGSRTHSLNRLKRVVKLKVAETNEELIDFRSEDNPGIIIKCHDTIWYGAFKSAKVCVDCDGMYDKTCHHKCRTCANLEPDRCKKVFDPYIWKGVHSTKVFKKLLKKEAKRIEKYKSIIYGFETVGTTTNTSTDGTILIVLQCEKYL